MICALEWVPQGSCRREPLRFEVSPEEAEMLQEAAREEEELDDSAAAAEDDEWEDVEEIDHGAEAAKVAQAIAGSSSPSDLPPEYRMDEYDNEDGIPAGMLASDAHFMEQDLLLGDVDDDEGSDAEDNVIEPTDSLFMSARTDEDSSLLELQCYDSETGNLWVHHDITLAAFPLSLAFMDIPPNETASTGEVGAYVAVGTFKPAIEIWNLDVLDPLEPSASLGGEIAQKPSKKKKKKKSKAPIFLPDSHTDAVMALHWNKLQRQILASGSADCTVKLWDVTSQQCSLTCTHHTNKVQAVRWHPTEATVLASGSYDRSMAVFDVRTHTSVNTFALPADVEDITWNPQNPEYLIGACEDGSVTCYDARSTGNGPIWTFQAHGKGSAVSSVTCAPFVSGLMATCSTDKTVKLWDIHTTTPTQVGTREMGVGKLFSMAWSCDRSTPFSLVCAGAKGIISLWETDESEAIPSQFHDRMLVSYEFQQAQDGTGEMAAEVQTTTPNPGAAEQASTATSKKKKKSKRSKKPTITK